MALIHLNFHSDALGMAVNAEVILPQKSTTLIGMDTGNGASTCKTLYLLHGLSDDHTIWQRRTSIERYAAKYDLAVVMPTGGVNLKNLGEYAACPIIAACGGSYMCPDKLIEAGAWDEITELCRKSVEIVKEARK